jgi:prophage antirepressor-like protein
MDINQFLIKVDESTIRYIILDNFKWYVCKDICDILGIKNNSEKIKILNINEIKRFKLHDNKINIVKNRKRKYQTFNLINENGLKRILLSSRSVNVEKILNCLKIELNIVFPVKESYCLRNSTKFLEAIIIFFNIMLILIE